MTERPWKNEDISVGLFLIAHGGGDIYQIGNHISLGSKDLRYYIHQVTFKYGNVCSYNTLHPAEGFTLDELCKYLNTKCFSPVPKKRCVKDIDNCDSLFFKHILTDEEKKLLEDYTIASTEYDKARKFFSLVTNPYDGWGSQRPVSEYTNENSTTRNATRDLHYWENEITRIKDILTEKGITWETHPDIL